jgi:Transposase DDE domain
MADTHHRDFVVRVNAGNSSRNIVYGAGDHKRVRDGWREATPLGSLTATRLCHDGKRKPYTADVRAMAVRVPSVKRNLWLCAFDCKDHVQPMVLLTTRPVSTLPEAAEVLALYFARWSIEELHRFAKQNFDLNNIRTLTWQRTKNMVAAVAIAMGVLALLPQRADAEPVLRDLELRGQRVRKPLRQEQFWGYALASGVASVLIGGRRLLHALPWYRHVPDQDRHRQPCLPGLGA